AAFARSRKNMPNSGPLVPPTPSQARDSAVSQAREVPGRSVSTEASSSFMAVRTFAPKSPSPARRSRSPRASAALTSASRIPVTRARPKSSPRVSVLLIVVSSPGKGGGADGGVPEPTQLVVQRHQGQREAVHVEAGDVGAHQPAADGD